MNAIELVAVCAIIETALIFYLSDIDKEPKNPSPRGLGRGGAPKGRNFVKSSWWIIFVDFEKSVEDKKKKKKKKMASLAIMIGGALINATAFVGGSYLAKYLIGEQNSAEEENKIHDLAVEKYHAAYEKHQENRTKLLD